MNEEQVKKFIRDEVSKSFKKRIGDTPTDNLQLTNKRYVDGKVPFVGVVGSNGVQSAPFPTGWVSSQLGVGDYVVTHNLNSSVYSLVANSNAPSTQIFSKGNTTFEIQTLNSAGANVNASVNFILAKK